MTRASAKQITLRSLKLRWSNCFKDGTPFPPGVTRDPITGVITRDLSDVIADDFVLDEWWVVQGPRGDPGEPGVQVVRSSPIVATPMRLGRTWNGEFVTL